MVSCFSDRSTKPSGASNSSTDLTHIIPAVHIYDCRLSGLLSSPLEMIYHYYASPWFATCHQPWSLLASTSPGHHQFSPSFPVWPPHTSHVYTYPGKRNETQKHQEGIICMYKKQIHTHRHALKKPESPAIDIVRNMVFLHSHIVMYPQTHTNTHTTVYCNSSTGSTLTPHSIRHGKGDHNDPNCLTNNTQDQS